MIVWDSDPDYALVRRSAFRARTSWSVIVRAWMVLGDFERTGARPPARRVAHAGPQRSARDARWNGLLFPIGADEASPHTSMLGNVGARR
jgi:hypothetical protein